MWIKALLVGILLIGSSILFLPIIKKLLEERIWLRYIIPVLCLIFVSLAYLSAPSYYFPHTWGVLGDNFALLYFITKDPFFIWVHHPFFPLISGAFLKLTTVLGFIDLSDPNYLEKVISIATFPARFLTSASLLLLFFYYRRQLSSSMAAFGIFLLFATSYGVWIYSFHHHAISVSLPFQILTFIVADYWYKTRKLIALNGLGFLAGINVYLEIVNVYFVLGITMAIITVIAIERKETILTRFNLFLEFMAPAFLLCVVYFGWEFKLTQTESFSELFHTLADTDLQGSYQIGNNIFDNFRMAVNSNFWFTTNRLLGELYPLDSTIYEPIYISDFFRYTFYIRLGSFIGFLVLIIYGLRHLKIENRLIFLMGLFTSLVFLVGFSLRPGVTDHYYVMDVVPNLMILVSLLFASSKDKILIPAIVISFVFAVSGIIYNGFSPMSVYRGNDLNDHAYYRNSNIIWNHTKEPAVYYKDIDFSALSNEWVKRYFEQKFTNVEWITDFPDEAERLLENLEQKQREDKNLFVSNKIFGIIKSSEKITAKQLSEDIYKVEIVPSKE